MKMLTILLKQSKIVHFIFKGRWEKGKFELVGFHLMKLMKISCRKNIQTCFLLVNVLTLMACAAGIISRGRGQVQFLWENKFSVNKNMMSIFLDVIFLLKIYLFEILVYKFLFNFFSLSKIKALAKLAKNSGDV